MILKFKEFYPKIAPSAWIAPSADLIGNIQIGEDSSVWFQCVIRADVNKVVIGKNSGIVSIDIWLEELDMDPISDNDLKLNILMDLKNKSFAKGGLLDRNEFIEIIQKHLE